MTCIVGLEDQGKVWVGADSAFSDGHTQGILSRDRPKVWRAGDYVVGVAGSSRTADIARYRTPWPAAPARGVLRHLVDVVVPLLRKVLKAEGRMLQDRDGGGGNGGGGGGYSYDGGDASDGVIMLAVGGRLFTIHGDFQVCRTRAGYDAIGSGAPFALGALHASSGTEARLRVRRALLAAETHGMGVQRPFRVLAA